MPPVALALAATLAVGGAQIEVTLDGKPRNVSTAEVVRWVETSARAVAVYYGRFPVPRARVAIHVVDDSDVAHGSSDGIDVDVQLGRDATADALAADWVMTHELTHLAFPSLRRRHHWMEEGLATYVEPIARAQLGTLPAEKVWRDLVDGLPQGLPERGDRGLDFTPTWGRTYWGGALYWLLADVDIRARTHNRKGVQDALRAVVAAGGTLSVDWSIDQVIAAGDAATGVPVLRETYEKMKSRPYAVDLAGLWRQLGVVADGRRTTFDDHAPLAAVRSAITAR